MKGPIRGEEWLCLAQETGLQRVLPPRNLPEEPLRNGGAGTKGRELRPHGQSGMPAFGKTVSRKECVARATSIAAVLNYTEG